MRVDRVKPVATLQDMFQGAVLANDPAPGVFVREGHNKKGDFDLSINAYRARLAAALCCADDLAAICEILAALDDTDTATEPSMLAASLLKQWLVDGLLVKVMLDD